MELDLDLKIVLKVLLFETKCFLIFCIFCIKFKIGGFFLSFACTPPVRLRGPPEAERIRRRITHTHTQNNPTPQNLNHTHTQRTVSQLRGLSSGGCKPSLFLLALTKILRRPPLFLLIAPLGDIASLSQSFFWQSESVHTYIPKV